MFSFFRDLPDGARQERIFLNSPWSCRSELKVALDGKSRYRFNECIG